MLDNFKRGIPRMGDKWEVVEQDPSVLDGECGTPERGEDYLD